MEYRFDKITVEVEEVNTSDSGWEYKGFFVFWDDKGFGFSRGTFDNDHIENAPEGEEVEYFFENLGMSYWARENGEDPKIYLSNINL